MNEQQAASSGTAAEDLKQLFEQESQLKQLLAQLDEHHLRCVYYFVRGLKEVKGHE